MLEIKNAKVYDLEECVIACRNAMRTDMPEYTASEFEKGLERAKKLVKTSQTDEAHCHDNFLTGIRVSFDLKYTQYITKQLQRYHWFDFVSSSSLMHKITQMDFDKCCNKYVTEETIENMKTYIAEYNAAPPDDKYEKFMKVISNCPMGTELFVRVSTNYKQLQTIYHQRKHHKLKEDYGALIKFIESLPYAKEFIIGENEKETL